MKKMINKTHIEGLIYETELKMNIAGSNAKNPGSRFISGKLHVEIEPNNVVTVDIFESELTSKGEKNRKFQTLENLLNAKTVIVDGRDNATKVKIDSSLALNEWYREDGTLVSTPRNYNGFIHIVNSITPKATFETDVVIVKTMPETKRVPGTDDVEETGRLIVQGLIFDYKNAVMPVNFIVENPQGVKFFESIEPYTFTKIWGRQVSTTIKTQKIEESAFGEPKVIESVTSRRELIIDGALKDGYLDESLLTKEELQKAIADRNVYLADLKTKAEMRKAQAQQPTAPAMDIAAGMFNF